ncbi:MAG TPA: ArsA-related P-loop ATPase [Thermoanaerobaculia bacterium]|nr:ArsA-related P-loop ATPase [Thermoanaerobaculia bacterium]
MNRPRPPLSLADLATRELVVVTGKGGVGKTVVAAALGRLLAALRRTLVLEVDPRENLHHMLGVPPSGGEVTEAIVVGDGARLWLQNLKPREVVDRLVAERLRIGPLTRRVLASPVYQQFAVGAPGLKEVAVLGHALRLVEGRERGRWGDRFELVVLDAPASGHGVSLLTAPRLLAEVIDSGPVGSLGRELAAFVADPSRCGVVAVTTPEEMPVVEALELAVILEERFGRRPDLLVVNGVYPPLPPGERDDPGLALWGDRRRVQEREIERLASEWVGPRVELPKLPVDAGPELVATLARCLEDVLGGGGAAAEASWS